MAMRTRREADGIRKQTAKLDERCIALAKQIIERVGTSDYDALYDALVKELAPVCEMSAKTAAKLALSMYQRMRKRDLGAVLEAAVTEPAWKRSKFETACGAAAAAGRKAGAEAALNVISSRIGYDNRAAKTSTYAANARIDSVKPKFARVPADDESCDFCQMLASAGFVNYNGSNGDDVHNHEHCRCEYMASWDKSPKAEGYDEKAWYAKWKATVDKEAAERAERNGTDAATEKKAIMKRYADASKRAKQRAKK